MKRFLLMRHAKSSWDNPHDADHARPLNDRGLEDAPRMGALLRDVSFDRLVSSDARRARETAELVQQELAAPPELDLFEDLYHAPPETWLETVAMFPADWSTVLGVGHNPGIEVLLHRLGGSGDVPTATIIDVRMSEWAAMADGEVARVWRVRDLPAAG